MVTSIPIQHKEFWNKSIYLIDMTKRDITTPGQSGPVSNNTELKNRSFTTSLMSYPGYPGNICYSTAEGIFQVS